MIRKNDSEKRGRPEETTPLFVEDCVRFDARVLLAKCRRAVDDAPTRSFTWSWTEYGRPRSRNVTLPVTSTRQPFGGVRRWWVCPFCRRRCGVLLAVECQGPIACRRCHRARYMSDYPGRSASWRL